MATKTDAKSVMSLLMMNQHTDMVREALAHAGGVTMMLRATPTSAVALEADIRQALITGSDGGLGLGSFEPVITTDEDASGKRQKKPSTKGKEAEKEKKNLLS